MGEDEVVRLRAESVGRVGEVDAGFLPLIGEIALTGGCGVLYAQFNFFFDPDSVFSLVSISVRVALICIIGGIGTVAGPIIGACFLLPLEELFNAKLSGIGAGVSQLAFGTILIAIILLEPRGLQALYRRLSGRRT